MIPILISSAARLASVASTSVLAAENSGSAHKSTPGMSLLKVVPLVGEVVEIATSLAQAHAQHEEQMIERGNRRIQENNVER